MGEDKTSRRGFLAAAGGVATAAAVGPLKLPSVHVQGDETIRVALVGCGGRGSGAAYDALNTKGPIKLVAMADAYADRLNGSYNALKGELKDKVDVPQERRFVGFDAYKKAMDVLRPGDVVIFATPPAFRWVHFQYAIAKKLNVFMEKPVTVDGPTSKRMLQLGEQSQAAGLKVGVGLMSRHLPGMQQLAQRIRNGEIGDITMLRGYRMHGPVGYFQSSPKPADVTELDYQVRRFHSFLWASGGAFSDFYIHIIDHLCWMKGAWPVKAQGLGGRHYKNDSDGKPWVDQNFDLYAVEYTFADGAKMLFDGRTMVGAAGIYSSMVHGTKGCAVVSRQGDFSGPQAIYRSQFDDGKPVWQTTDGSNPYQVEWDVLIAAIRNNRPHNEVKRGVEASLVTSLGRMAAHSGQEVTYNEILNSDFEMAPGLDKIVNSSSPAPLKSDASGKYPVPEPGRKGKREY